MSHVEYSVMRKEIFNQRDLIVGRLPGATMQKSIKNTKTLI